MKKQVLVRRVPNPHIVWFHFKRVVSQTHQEFWRPLSALSEGYLSKLKNEKTAKAIRRIIRLPGVERVTISTYELYAEYAEMFTRSEIEPTVLRILCEEIFEANVEDVEVTYK